MSTFIYSPDSVPAWQKQKSPAEVSKIVLGTLGNPITAATLPDFASVFPNLKALHLWDLTELTSITSLPPSLEILDIRNCPNLTTIPTLPSSLYDLVLDNLPSLQHLTTTENPSTLHDVAIVKCIKIQGDDINRLLAAMVAVGSEKPLGCLDLSGCSQITQLPTELPNFTRIILNDCKALSKPPDKWPAKLTRLDLARTAVAEIKGSAELRSTIDHVDLTGCVMLGRIDNKWTGSRDAKSPEQGKSGGLRTLFLSGSGVKSPPAMLHGVGKQNVASDVAHYFSEIDTVGAGSFLRCKVLLLGNGGAGKTTLSLSLEGKTEYPGTTHGIRLENWALPAAKDQVERMIWDFGGQEIYHNTHSIFLKTNAIFVILWDGKMTRPEGASEKDWRPLNYWIDYIVNYGPTAPSIAIVYNQWTIDSRERTKATMDSDKLKKKLKKEIQVLTEPRRIQFELFILDAKEKTGDYDGFVDWAERVTGQLAKDQGEAVPCYWEIAAAIVNDWTAQDEPKELSVEDFQKDLEEVFALIATPRAVESPRLKSVRIKGESITKAVEKWRGNFTTFRRVLNQKNFEVTTQRMAYLLDFLHNSGMIYWKKEKAESRVIISQRWALEGIYAILKREPEYFEKIHKKHGVFNRSSIDALWDPEKYNSDQRILLLRYMEYAGACFALIPGEQRADRDTVYLSLAHLSSMEERNLQIDWETAKAKKLLSSKLLHLGHWHAILRTLGRAYGRDAEYASDGFVLKVKDRQTVIVWVDIHTHGIGGSVHLLVEHPNPDERAKIEKNMADLILREIPSDEGVVRDEAVSISRDQTTPAGIADTSIRVFISYASPPPEGRASEEIRKQYSESRDFVKKTVEAFEASEDGTNHRYRFEPVVDSDDKEGIGIGEFFDTCKKSDWMIMITSDRYWKSPWCLYEFISTRNRKGEEFIANMMAISLKDCGINNAFTKLKYVEENEQIFNFHNKYLQILHGSGASSPESRDIFADLGENENEILEKLNKMGERANMVKLFYRPAMSLWWNECWDHPGRRCKWDDGRNIVKKTIESCLSSGLSERRGGRVPTE